MEKTLLAILSCSLLVLHTQAQATRDSVLKQTTIEVIQAYKPEIKAINRPELTPDLPTKDTSRPAFKYVVPQQTLNYTYRALPLRPLLLNKDTFKLPFPGYVQAGIGNLSTLYLDAGSGHIRGDDYQAAIHLSHISQNGGQAFQKTSLTDLDASGYYHGISNRWNGHLNILRHQYFNYGFNPGSYGYTEDDLRSPYTGASASIGLSNLDSNGYGLNYQPFINAGFYTSRNNRELQVEYILPGQYILDSNLTLHVSVNGSHAVLSRSGGSIGNQMFSIQPGVSFRKEQWTGYLGLSPTFATYGKVALLPNMRVNYGLPGQTLTLHAGWQAALQLNTFRQLTTTNPFLNEQYLFKQTRKDEFFAGLDANFGNHVTVAGKLAYTTYKNLPLYLNDTGDARSFYLVYEDKVNALSFQFGLRYQIASTVSAGATATIFSYSGFNSDQLWHMPKTDIRTDVTCMPVKNLTITMYGTAMTGIYGRDVFGNEAKLEPIIDLGGGVTYRFLPRLSVFANANNILNAQNQRWKGFNAYGFNIYGGVRLLF